jgi:dihydrofolate reductase
VFVLTREKREPWVRKGGTTFFFVNDGIESALKQAREAAGAKDIRIGGGAHVIREYLSAGLVEELHLAVTPVLLGAGTSLFDRLDSSRFGLKLKPAVPTRHATHHFYEVTKR